MRVCSAHSTEITINRPDPAPGIPSITVTRNSETNWRLIVSPGNPPGTTLYLEEQVPVAGQTANSGFRLRSDITMSNRQANIVAVTPGDL